MLGTFGSIGEDSPPEHDLSGTSVTETINDPDYRANIGAQDQSGNIDWVSYGPWHLGQVYGVLWDGGGAFQSLALTTDGTLDIKHNEWLTLTELVDTDDRRGIPQSLYSTWDSYWAYIGWQGAVWDNDGTMWVYWDLDDGVGTDVPVSGSAMLPFDADYAASVDSASSSQGWICDGANWVTGGDVFAQHDPDTGGLELTFEFSSFVETMDSYDHHRMFAYAVNDSDEVWSAFPILNDLDGNFVYFYE